MGLLEKQSLSGKNREFWTVMLLVVRDAQREAGVTSIWTKLSPLGSIMLGGEINERPRDSVWWIDDLGKRTRIHTDFGKWKKDIKLAASGFGVADALKARNQARWSNALTIAAVAGAVIATVASGGAAASIIGPIAAGVLASAGAVVGTTSAALREMVGSSGDGLSLDEIAAGFREGEAFYEAASEGTFVNGEYQLPGLVSWEVPDRPDTAPLGPGVSRRVGEGPPRPGVDVESPRVQPDDDEDAEEGMDPIPVLVGLGLLAGAAVLTVGVVGGLAYASRRAA